MKNKFWFYNIVDKWHLREVPSKPYQSYEELPDFIDELGYKDPDLVIGDEFNFTAVYEHPEKEEYLLHIEIDDFVKIIFADSLPAMFIVLEKVEVLIIGYFRTLKLMESLKNG